MKPLSEAPLWGRLLALPTNIRLGCKSLQGTNTLAYYAKVKLRAPKNCILEPGPNVIKLFTVVIYNVLNKLECLSLAGLPSLV